MQVEGREPSPDTPPGEISPPPPPQSEAPPPQRHLLPASQPGTPQPKSPLHLFSMLATRCYHNFCPLPQAH